jgi:hypothetical protein
MCGWADKTGAALLPHSASFQTLDSYYIRPLRYRTLQTDGSAQFQRFAERKLLKGSYFVSI